jgi:DNA-binding SARP family transcriptional activator
VTETDDRVHAEQVLVAVLGPTSVGGKSVTPRQRSLVSALALNGHDGAGIDLLADGVWGERPPATARSALQNQITRLRRAFGPGLILCDQGRYRLGAETDVGRFESLVTPWLHRDLSTAAISDLCGGLELWRGTPYTDVVGGHDTDIERVRLEQLRSLAVERLSIARIIHNQPGVAAVELSAHAERDRYHERTWELLLLAHHLSGRDTEAVAAQGRYQTRLRDELGAEPSASFLGLGLAIASGEVIDLASYLGAEAAAELEHPGFIHHPGRCRGWRHMLHRPQCGRPAGTIRDSS